ncbi:MAG TPA: SDR family oxidoreductase [Candidatus Megaira endosymbiont of Nemacystus decipiens]|nr:SDR family oxidoreductase [Candidatus Megaera endosymbiont of Nemacystus decipiens]
MRLKQLYDFHGKTALITGASGGLGEQFARCLHARGARVILASRRLKSLQDLSDELGNSKAIKMDVADKNSVVSCFAELEKIGEKIDICINNAGIAKLTPIFQEEQNDDFESLIQTNLMGVWYVTKAIANHMKNNNVHGSIINIGSINGASISAKKGSAYSISKAAVIHLTKTLVGELSPYNIRINCISPGFFKTAMTEAIIDKVTPHIPTGSAANPADMDGLIMYLSSNEASGYVTGSSFTIDGGISWGGKLW